MNRTDAGFFQNIFELRLVEPMGMKGILGSEKDHWKEVNIGLLY